MVQQDADKHSKAATRIEELRALLHRANRAYYVDAAPFMSDGEFDVLLTELSTLEQSHPELSRLLIAAPWWWFVRQEALRLRWQ